MRVLKLVIVGEILLILLKFHPHEGLFTREEKRIYYDLKKCAVILMKERDDGRAKIKIAPQFVKLCLTSVILTGFI